jgi:hypothetical protein
MLKLNSFSKDGMKKVIPNISPRINAKNVMSRFSDKNWIITTPLVAPTDFRTPISFNLFVADTMAILI